MAARKGTTVTRVRGGVKAAVSLFLVEHRGVLTLVDTGTAGSLPKITRALTAAGRRPEDVRQIVLTHCHGDHTGTAAALRAATGASVVAGAPDVGPIEGTAPYPGPRDRLFKAVFADLVRFDRLPVDVAVSERQELEGGLVAIPTPGHTAGHIAVLVPDLDTVLAGDLVWHLGPLRPSWRRLTQDPERNAESIRELAALGHARIEPGHGRAVSGDQLRDLAGRV
ncbi:MAG: MBL fold metallo-hydrolase [Actinomycetota bacterium]|nr:MBL fold metallo-hydrolase [Actinomycetota bacterium]